MSGQTGYKEVCVFSRSFVAQWEEIVGHTGVVMWEATLRKTYVTL